jgi:HEAT repeat protein
MTTMDASEIIALLEAPTDNRGPTRERIAAEAAVHELAAALTRQILCDILGERRATEAVPELLQALDDPSPNVRSSAADALAQAGDVRVGASLLEHYHGERDDDVRVMLAIALGAVGYEPAIPDLVRALDDPYRTLQMEAAWSLGELGASEARQDLTRVLARMTTDHARGVVRQAIAKLA